MRGERHGRNPSALIQAGLMCSKASTNALPNLQHSPAFVSFLTFAMFQKDLWSESLLLLQKASLKIKTFFIVLLFISSIITMVKVLAIVQYLVDCPKKILIVRFYN